MENVQFIMEVDDEIADQVVDRLGVEVGAQVYGASKHHLDGSPETVIQIIELALATVNVAIPFILDWTRQDRIHKIRVGEIEIDNPTPEQVEVLWRNHLERLHDD